MKTHVSLIFFVKSIHCNYCESKPSVIVVNRIPDCVTEMEFFFYFFFWANTQLTLPNKPVLLAV